MTSVIDLAKSARRTGKKALNAVMSVAEWNAKNPTHPRAGDGKFKDAFSAVSDFGQRENLANALDAMVREHGGHETPLGQSLLAAIGRSGPSPVSDVKSGEHPLHPGKSAAWVDARDRYAGDHFGRSTEQINEYVKSDLKRLGIDEAGLPRNKDGEINRASAINAIIDAEMAPKTKKPLKMTKPAGDGRSRNEAGELTHHGSHVTRSLFGSDPLPGTHEWRKRQEAGAVSGGAKPLTVSKPAAGKGLDEGKVARLKAMRASNYPMESDVKELETMLSGMTIAQLHEAAEHLGNPHASKSYKLKADIQRNVSGILGSRRGMNAIIGGPEHEKAKAREEAEKRIGKGQDFDEMYRGTDSERRGSMAAKRQAREALEQERAKRDQDLKDLATLSPDQLSERLRQNTIKRQNPDIPQAERNDLIVEHSELQRLMGVKVTTAKPVKARTPDPAETGKYSQGMPTRSLDAMVADPQSGDREGMRALLSGKGMTISAIESFYQGKTGHKIPSNYRTKQDKINHTVESLVGHKINSDAIRNGVWHDNQAPESVLSGALEAPRVKSQREGSIVRSQEFGERKLSGNPRAVNTWGGERDKDAIHYHADGEIGVATDQLGEDTFLEVQGDSLVNRLDRIASDTVAGKTTPAQQIEELKKLHGALPEGPGKRAVGGAIRNLDAPVKKAPVTVPAGTPEPIKDFVTDLAKIPLMSQTNNSTSGQQAKRLWEKVQDFADQVAQGRKPEMALMRSTLSSSIPHESLEGAAQVRALVQRLMEQLRG